MGQAIATIKRSAPFILFHGSAIHLVLEGQPFLRVETTMDAVLALMALYYVFDLSYSEEVKPTLLFLQEFLLKMPDDYTANCESASIFIKLVQKEEERASAARNVTVQTSDDSLSESD